MKTTEEKAQSLREMVSKAHHNGTLRTFRGGMHALYADAIRATAGRIDATNIDRVYRWAEESKEVA
jgi:hypothetical protein